MRFSIFALFFGLGIPVSVVGAQGWTEDRVIARVLELSPDLARADAALEEARAGAVQAWLPFLPHLEVSLRYTRVSDIDNAALTQVFTPQQQADLEALVPSLDDPAAQMLWTASLDAQEALANYELPVLRDQRAFRASVSYPLSRVLLSVLPAARAAGEFVEAQEALLEATQQRIELTAGEAFYQVVRAEHARQIAAESLAQAEAHFTRTGAMERTGAASRVELLRVQAQLSAARVADAQAAAGLIQARSALAALVDVDPDDFSIEIDLTTAVPADPGGSIEQLIAQALAERSDLRALEHFVIAAERRRVAERGRHFPELGVVANVDVANPNPNYVPQQDRVQTSWDVSAILRWSPNETIDARQRTRQASSTLDRLRAERDALRRALTAEVWSAHADREAAALALEAAQSGVEAAQANYRAREALLRTGAAVHSDLIDARLELARARLQLLDAQIGVRLARTRMLRALGML